MEESKQIKSEVKVSEQDADLSCFDKIVLGDRKGVKILHEDDKCIAFEDIAPVAKVHLIVLAKEAKASITNPEAKDEALIGHLMLTASKVAAKAGLVEGYRVVLNQGKNSFQTIPNLYLHVIGGQQLLWPPT